MKKGNVGNGGPPSALDQNLSGLRQALIALAAKYQAKKLILFGSRARGDAAQTSDIDLAVVGMPEENRALFWSDLDDLPTLLSIDLVHLSPHTPPALLENIKKDGVILMDRAREKRDKLKDALDRLKEALDEYSSAQTSVVRDGVIQRFEFCTELAWKAAREYLLDQGYTEINSPKAVMRKAYADGLISDQNAWLKLLEDRNLTSHIYDDSTAAMVFHRIESSHLPLFCALCQALEAM